jgi:hypothetical protein
MYGTLNMKIKRRYIYVIGELINETFVVLSCTQSKAECYEDLIKILKQPHVGLFIRAWDPYTGELMYGASSMMNGAFIDSLIDDLKLKTITENDL